MKEDTDIEVPPSPLLRRQAEPPYGHVAGLDDSELADPDELERMMYQEAFAPVLALPVQARTSWIKPNVDEDGTLDWGAFGTVDFDRYLPKPDWARHRIEQLKDQLAHECIMMDIISDRIKTPAKYVVLKFVRMGILDIEHIVDFDMDCLARRTLRARYLERQIAELRDKASQRR